MADTGPTHESNSELPKFENLFVIYHGDRCIFDNTDVLCLAPKVDFFSKPTYETLVPIATLREQLLYPENGIQWGEFTPRPGKSPIFLDTSSDTFLIFLADPSGKIILYVKEQRPDQYIYIHAEAINSRPHISSSRIIQVWPCIQVPERYERSPAYHTFKANQIVFIGNYTENSNPFTQHR